MSEQQSLPETEPLAEEDITWADVAVEEAKWRYWATAAGEPGCRRAQRDAFLRGALWALDRTQKPERPLRLLVSAQALMALRNAPGPEVTGD